MNSTPSIKVRSVRLPHRWRLMAALQFSAEMVRAFIRPAICAVPASIACRLGPCIFRLVPSLEGEGIVSRWTETDEKVEITVSAEGLEPHDAALELLVCIGQALWEKATPAEYTAWLGLLRTEVEAGVRGEIDDYALRSKHELLSSRTAARSTRRLHTYAAASFGSTAAEYIHGLWHDVTVRAGPEHLPAAWLRTRIEFMVKFFPPDPGQRVIAQEQAPV